MDARVFLVAACAALLVVGLALGAESQRETFLHPDALQDVGLGDAAGNLVVLTAFVPAMAIAVGATLLSRRPWPQRILPSWMVGIGAFLLVVLVQSSWPNYDSIVEQRTASFSITPLISNGDAVPTVFLGPIAVLLAAAALIAQGTRRLMPARTPDDTPDGVLRRFLEAYALAAPFLVLVVLGNLRLLIGLPDGQAATVPYLFVFPSSMLAALGLLVVGGLKAWHLGVYVRNSRVADSVQETWSALRRAEWILLGVLAGIALLATVLKAIPSDLLEAGRTFGVSARGHAQFQFLVIWPLLGWLALDGPVRRTLAMDARHPATLEMAPDPRVIGTFVALGIGALAAAVATWALDGALWPWALMFAPVTWYAWRRFSAIGSLWPGLVLAIVCWGIGNTVVGVFRLTENADHALTLQDPPGVLALFRFLGVLVAAVSVARLARAHVDAKNAVAWPLAALIAGAVGLLMFLELSFAAWIAPRSEGEFVGIGSLIASQDRAVRAAMHGLAGVGAFLAGVAVARIHRPDWFGRKPPTAASAADPSTFQSAT